jgi:NIMA (never in mitosis gene a)-related kinase
MLFLDKLIKKIEVGTSGTVFCVKNNSTNVIMAMKAIPLKTSKENASIKREVKIGLEVGKNCPFLVHYFETFEDSDFYYIIMDYFNAGDLIKYTSDGNVLTEKEIIRLSCHIGKALQFLHEQKIIHRDVKPQNIFVDERGIFRLGDYSIAITQSLGETMTSSGTTFTYFFSFFLKKKI